MNTPGRSTQQSAESVQQTAPISRLPSAGAGIPDESSVEARPLRLLAVDGHRLMLRAVDALLEPEPDLAIVGRTHHYAEVLPLMGRTAPDVVLLGAGEPWAVTLMLLDRIRSRFPATRVVVLAELRTGEEAQEALARGADGFVTRAVTRHQFAPALRDVLGGGLHTFDGDPAGDETAERARARGLTRREQAVLTRVAAGCSNKQVARELSVTEQTVKFHLRNLYRKLGVRNRTGLLRRALAGALVEQEGRVAACGPARPSPARERKSAGARRRR